MNSIYWTKNEIEQLKFAYTNQNTIELNKVFPNRTTGAVFTKAWELGLKRPKHLIIRADCLWHGKVLKNFTESEKGYLAGIIDCDGCITFMHKRGTNIYTIVVDIANTNIHLMKWLSKKIQSTKFYTLNNNPKVTKPCHHWKIGRHDLVTKFLSEIAPYLVRKRLLAERLSMGYRHLDDRERKALLRFVRQFNKIGTT